MTGHPRPLRAVEGGAQSGHPAQRQERAKRRAQTMKARASAQHERFQANCGCQPVVSGQLSPTASGALQCKPTSCVPPGPVVLQWIRAELKTSHYACISDFGAATIILRTSRKTPAQRAALVPAWPGHTAVRSHRFQKIAAGTVWNCLFCWHNGCAEFRKARSQLVINVQQLWRLSMRLLLPFHPSRLIR